MNNEIKRNIEVENYKLPKWILADYGIVNEVKDGIVVVKVGLNTVGMSEMVIFEKTGIKGIVNFLGKEKSITVLGSIRNIKVGDMVKRLKTLPFLPVTQDLLGRVIDPIGNVLDGGEKIISKETRSIEIKAPGIIARESVRNSLETGVKFLDSMIPIGLGQRELLIGDPKTGKTTTAIDTILNQKGKGVLCVYVVIGQKQTSLLKIIKTLKVNNCFSFTTIVMASAAESAAMQYLAPFSGASIGEYFMSKGRDVLIVFDDLSKHAVAYRQMSLLLRRPPGREGYPGDVWATVRLHLCMFNIKNNIKEKKFIKNLSKFQKSINFHKKIVRNYNTVNNIKKKYNQVVNGFGKLQIALDQYDKDNNLKFIDRLSTALFFTAFLSWCLCLTEISIFFSPITLCYISLFEYILGFILVIYTGVKRLYFIYNYDLDCNPSVLVKLLMGEVVATRTFVKSFVFATGSAVTSNYTIDEFTNVSIFREYGKNYIYGDKSFLETIKIVYGQITNNNGDRFDD